MLLSESIKQLQSILKEYGDMELEIAWPCYESSKDICTDTSNDIEIKFVDYGKEYGGVCRIQDVS